MSRIAKKRQKPALKLSQNDVLARASLMTVCDLLEQVAKLLAVLNTAQRGDK